jgi:hypothetical protein
MAYYINLYPCQICSNGFAMGLLLSGSGDLLTRHISTRSRQLTLDTIAAMAIYESIIMVGLLDLTILLSHFTC